MTATNASTNIPLIGLAIALGVGSLGIKNQAIAITCQVGVLMVGGGYVMSRPAPWKMIEGCNVAHIVSIKKLAEKEATLKAQLEETEKRIEQLRSLIPSLTDLTKLDDKNTELESERHELEQEVRRLQALIPSLKHLTALDAQSSALTDSCDRLMGQVKGLEEIYSRKRSEYDTLESAHKLRCDQMTSDRNEELKLELEDLQAELADLKRERGNLEREIEGLQLMAEGITTKAETDAERVKSKILIEAERDAARIKLDAEAEGSDIRARIVSNARATLQDELAPIRESHETQIDALVEQAAALETQIEQLQAGLEQLEANIEDKEAELEEKEALFDERIEAKKEKLLQDNEKHRADIMSNAKKLVKDAAVESQQLIDSLMAQIEALTSENLSMKEELERLDDITRPEGYSTWETYARAVQDIYLELDIKLDYVLSYKQDTYIIVQLKARDLKVGEAKLRPYADRLQDRLRLDERPNIAMIAGGVVFYLRPSELRDVPTETMQQMHPRIPLPMGGQIPDRVQRYNENRDEIDVNYVPALNAHLGTEGREQVIQETWMSNYHPPDKKFSPYGDISEEERMHVLWLWVWTGTHDQNAIMGRVWKNSRGRGVRPGGGAAYIGAKKKLHTILDEAGLDRRVYSTQTEGDYE